MNHIDKVETLMARLCMQAPYFTAAALRLKIEKNTSIPTFATNGKKLLFNPDYLEKLLKSQNGNQIVVGVLAHEIMHCLRLHQFRMGARDPVIWNCACDYVINNELLDAGYRLPENVLVGYPGETEERIYQLLEKEGIPESAQDKLIGDVYPSDSYKEGTKAVESEIESWKETVKASAATYETKKKLEQGTGSVGLDRLFDAYKIKSTPWTKILSAWLVRTRRSKISFSNVNRRFIQAGLHLPGKIKQKVGSFLIYVDTSGSISSKDLGLFAACIKKAMQQAKPKSVIIVYADSEITHVDEFTNHRDIVIKPKGGGGTDFVPVFEYAEQRKDEIDCVICFSDGYGRYPETEFSKPVMWLLNSNYNPPWGLTMRINNE